MYQSRANAPLDAMAKLCGFPGKLGMDGSQVYGAYLEGRTRRDPPLLRNRRDEHLPAVVPLRADARPPRRGRATGARSAWRARWSAAIDEPHWRGVPGRRGRRRRLRAPALQARAGTCRRPRTATAARRRAVAPERCSPAGRSPDDESARRRSSRSSRRRPRPTTDRDDDLHRFLEHRDVVVARRQARVGLVEWSAIAPSMIRSYIASSTPSAARPEGRPRRWFIVADRLGDRVAAVVARSARPIACAIRSRRRSLTIDRRAGVELHHRRQEHRVQRAVVQLRDWRRRGCGSGCARSRGPSGTPSRPACSRSSCGSAPRGRCRRAVARSMCAQARSRPSRAMPSAGGLTAGAMKVSMQWAIASMPVAAVRNGGRPSVSSGSQMAVLGTRCQLWKPSFLPSSTMTIAPRATSLPVPAVVGHGDQRRDPLADARAAAFDRRVGRERPVMRRGDGDALGEVDARAAADRDQAVAAVAAVERRRRRGRRARSGSTAWRRTPRARRPPSAATARSSRPAARTPASVTSSGFVMPARSQLLRQEGEGAEVELDLGDVVDEGHAPVWHTAALCAAPHRRDPPCNVPTSASSSACACAGPRSTPSRSSSTATT